MPKLLLRDDQWLRIEPMLHGKARDRGLSGADNRLFVEAVLWIARKAPLDVIPARFGPWNTAFRCFSRWADKGVWQTLLAKLCEDGDFEEMFLESMIVQANQHAVGAPKKRQQSLGRSRGSLSTRIHAAVDGLGNLARFRLTSGERHDITEAANHH